MNGHLSTLQRSPVNNAAAADVLRKKMQQLRDELEHVKDDLDRARKEYEKERHSREVVSWIHQNGTSSVFLLFYIYPQAESEVNQLSRKLQSYEEQLERTEQRLMQTTAKLDEASHTADERERFPSISIVTHVLNWSSRTNSFLDREKC